MICFTVMACGMSVVMAWIRPKSGGVWTAMFAHAAHNVLVQTTFNPLMLDVGPTEYLIGEFGTGLATVYVVAAVLSWRLRDRLPGEDVSAIENWRGRR